MKKKMRIQKKPPILHIFEVFPNKIDKNHSELQDSPILRTTKENEKIAQSVT